MEFLQSENAPAAIGPYSQAVKLNGMLYTSGQIALELNGEMVENDIKKQTKHSEPENVPIPLQTAVPLYHLYHCPSMYHLVVVDLLSSLAKAKTAVCVKFPPD